jgi:septal ring factor EnvC (AmiA/AmiB activator)
MGPRVGETAPTLHILIVPTGTAAASKTRCAKSPICRLRKTISRLQSSLNTSAAQFSHLESIISDLRAENASLASTIATQHKTTNSLQTQLDAANAAHSECLSQLVTSERQALQKSRQPLKRLEGDYLKNALAIHLQALWTLLDARVLQTPLTTAERDADGLNDQGLRQQQRITVVSANETVQSLHMEQRKLGFADWVRQKRNLQCWRSLTAVFLTCALTQGICRISRTSTLTRVTEIRIHMYRKCSCKEK